MKNILKLIFAILLVLLVIIVIRSLPKKQTTPPPVETKTEETKQEETPAVTVKAETEDDLQKLIDADQDNAYEEELTGLESETN